MSQNFVSLVVALIALLGVLATTWLNNARSDKRLREELSASKNKWLKQLAIDEKARQRHAVANFFTKLRMAEHEADSFSRDQILSSLSSPDRVIDMDFKLKRAFKREDFYVDMLTAIQELQLEITQSQVAKALQDLVKQFQNEILKFQKLRDTNRTAWIESVGSTVTLSEEMQRKMNDLRTSALENLHPIQLVDNEPKLGNSNSKGSVD